MEIQLKKSLTDSSTEYVFGYPFGIEKIDNRDYVIFREFGNRRIYIREDSFTSKEQAKEYLNPIVEKYSNSIITALEESN